MNKTALITGASSGIGFALAGTFAQNGYNLVLVSQNEKNLNDAFSKLKKQYIKVKINTFASDLSKTDSPQMIYDFVKGKAIEVDVLVNCAGIQVYESFHERDITDTLQLMQVNMFAPVVLTKLFLEDMVKRKKGKILNVASTGAFAPCALNAAYCASKAFIMHFSEGIAEELKGSGITVTTLCPGATKTNFAKRANIEDTKMFSNTMKSDKVATVAYKALEKGKPIVIPGINNNLLTFSIRFMPRQMVAKMGGQMMSRK
ncbi:MAG: SDR family oxidoreductase [Clostridiales bacterium]|uniref:SDR family NAD(P)-dependent oxidoreductase n=1 Tax=Aminipila sp. TaxID=2060095 RepID=UPI001E125F34|nr:SDR family oxidoreductase [Aminipila sp.]MBE6035289.1 SDR family oxidoreductase [Clostridiales bacterium]